mmetsp:Transcript_33499/g.53882  ORF Transcript_33499/g.53882 Transcript_33499/m.53882 type:complete len:292 (-) Transcript_33499:364-1239(-)
MNNIMSPAFFTSSRIALNLSSNSPLYLVPAITAARSRATTLFPANLGGTFPSTIICASPSAIAVFPTPGSPIKQGLFFMRLTSICIALSTSFSRPTTGSSEPSLASLVKSSEHFSRVAIFPTDAPAPTATRSALLLRSRSPFIFSKSAPRTSRVSALMSRSRSIPNTINSVPICVKPISLLWAAARWKTLFTPSENGTSVVDCFLFIPLELPRATDLSGFHTPPPPPVSSLIGPDFRMFGCIFRSVSRYLDRVMPYSSLSSLVVCVLSSLMIASISSWQLTSSRSRRRTSS